MGRLTRYNLPAVALVVVGVGVGVATVGQAATMVQWEDTYRYTVDQTDEPEIPRDATVTPFQELSPTAQEIFLTGHDRGDDYTRTKRAPDFQYDDDDVPVDGYNYVQYEGDYYRVWAEIVTGGSLGALVLLTGGLPAALVLACLGLVCWAYTLVKIPSSVLSGLVMTGIGMQTAGVTLVTVGGGVAAMLLTWLALALLDRYLQVPVEPRSE